MTFALPSDTTERLRREGFLLLPLPGPSLQAIDAAFDAARSFFAEPDSEKDACRLPLDCGYRPCGAEFSMSPDIPDALESFTISERTRGNGNALVVASGLSLHQRMFAAFTDIEILSERLICRIANDVGHDAPQLVAGSLRRWSRLQLNHAQPNETSNDFINEVHEDGHFLTIVKSTGAGLEVRLPSGEFVPLPVGTGEVLIMPGQIACLMTGGVIQPLYHRVRKVSDQPGRMALLFFADIAPEHCIPWKRTPENAGIDIAQRVLTNSSRFGVRDFPLQ
jgi:isopenicillin N synthase-like dioxygenase